MPRKKPAAPKQTAAPEMVRQIGRYIVADPKICHGALTFRGTRIFVADVLDQVAEGMPWEHIMDEWHGKVPREAIAEAVRLARETFVQHAAEYSPHSVQRKAS